MFVSSYFDPLIKGIAFGITMAAIPGPIFFLIMQRTIIEGELVGFFCGLGSIGADAFYALLAAIGLSYIMDFLIIYQSIFSLLGSFFILYLGYSIFKRTPATKNFEMKDKSLVAALVSTFFITVSNPVTIFSYCVIFASLGIDGNNHHWYSIILLLTGVIIGSLCFVLVFIGFLHYFKSIISYRYIVIFNKIIGIILIGFAFYAFVKSFNPILPDCTLKRLLL